MALLFHWAGWSFWEALPLAGAAAAMFGFVLGFPVLRLRGDYLAIVTLGFGEIIRLMLVNLTSITGGPDGISSIPKPTVLGLEMTRNPSTEGGTTFHQFLGLEFSSLHMVIFLYLMALLLAVITLCISNRLVRMPIGRAWEALREDEIACRSLGLNPMEDQAVRLHAGRHVRRPGRRLLPRRARASSTPNRSPSSNRR